MLISDWLGQLTSSSDYLVFNLVTVVVASPRYDMIVRFWYVVSLDHLGEFTSSLDYWVFKLMTVVVDLTLNGMIVGVGVSCHRLCLGFDVF